jgi:hypothetical protein
VRLGSKLLDSLDSDAARRHWGHWKGVRIVVAYTIWFFRFRHQPGEPRTNVVTESQERALSRLPILRTSERCMRARFERGCQTHGDPGPQPQRRNPALRALQGANHTAEVVLDPKATGDRPIAYRVDGKEELFKSPSAAGTAVTGKACNGWAFWSVGDGSESTGPVTSTKSRPPSSTVHAAPKPQGKRRGRKGQSEEPPASDAPVGDEARDDAPTATQPDDQPVTCAECGETFPGVQAATEHYYSTHGKPLDEEPTA